MRTLRTRVALGVFTCCALFGQTEDKSLTFEVASVKPSAPIRMSAGGTYTFRGPSGGPGSKEPGHISYPNMSLKNLLMNAYDMRTYQISGPDWLDTERFDINATMPPETTREQFRIMLQNLLAERFTMVVHRDTKEMPAYVLTVNKGGPKMKESEPVTPADADAPQPPPISGPVKIGPDGFPDFPMRKSPNGSFGMMMMPGRARMVAQGQTMNDLAKQLSSQLRRPVTDATGLAAKYDFTLTYSPEGVGGGMAPMGAGPAMAAVPAGAGTPPPPPPGGRASDTMFVPEGDAPPTIFGALQSQLGLKLDQKKAQVEIIVVDSAEKVPTEN